MVDHTQTLLIQQKTIEQQQILLIKKITYATTALNHEKVGKYLERSTEIKHLIGKYNQKKINVPSKKDNCKKIEKTM